MRWAWLCSASHAPVPSTPLQCHPTAPHSPAPAPSTHAPCHVVKAAHAAQPDIPMGLCDYISGPLYRPGVIYDYKHGSTSHWHSRGVYVTERLPLSSQPSANNWRTDQRDVISPSVIYLSAESPPSHRGTVPGPERKLTSRAGVAAHMLIWRIQSACPQVFRFCKRSQLSRRHVNFANAILTGPQVFRFRKRNQQVRKYLDLEYAISKSASILI